MVTDQNAEPMAQYVKTTYKKTRLTTQIRVHSIGGDLPLVQALPKLWEEGILRVDLVLI